jgi:hypothetical protein
MEIVLQTSDSYKRHINILDTKPLTKNTKEEQTRIIINYLEDNELLPDEEHKAINNNVLIPLLEDETQILTDTEETDTEDTDTVELEDTFNIPDINKQKKTDTLDLDIDNDKVLSFYKEIPIKELADKTRKKDQILKRIAEHNLQNDTADIDFYKDKTERPSGNITELSGIFCDNLILSGLTTTSRLTGKNCKDCGSYTTRAREYYKERELHTTIKPVDITDPEPEDITTERINIYRETILKGAEIKGAWKIQNIKVATPDVRFTDIIRYTHTQHLQYLNKDGLFLHDIDYTQDVAGCIDKHKFIDYFN